MSTAQSAPPSLDGFTFISWLGGGGFADVFLYQQQFPDRRVAVKVLRGTVDDEDALRDFNAEANLMAKVSTHPNIVTIYSAGVSNDRRPYLVMEFYPLSHYGDRLKQSRLPVHEVLQVGIKIGAAIETAHRNQIIHRDIKPANILSSDFGEPGLADFGISATRTEQTTDESMGFSPPFAPPEILADESPGDERSDIYSLAATLWAMLAGHSPFELSDQRNPRGDVIRRGLNDAVPRLPRGDVPASLEYALQHALSKDPNRRPASALSFAMTLQGVEQELGYRPTPLNLVQDASTTGPAILDAPALLGEKTKIGRGKVVNPDGPRLVDSAPPMPTTRRSDSGLITAIPKTGAGFAASGVAPTMARLPQPVAPEDEHGTVKIDRSKPATVSVAPATTRRLPTWAWIGLVVVLVGVLVVVAVTLLGGSGSDSRPSEDTISGEDPGPLTPNVVTVADVVGLTAMRDGTTVHFTWTASATADVQYRVTRVESGAPTDAVTLTTTPSFDLTDIDPTSAPCVSVLAFVPGTAEAPGPEPIVCVGG